MLRALPQQTPPRQPIFNMPAVVVGTIGVLVLLHGLRAVLSPGADLRLLVDLAFIPARWSVAWNPARAGEIMSAIAQEDTGREMAMRLTFARYVLGEAAEPRYWSVLTYALLHGSWAHVLLNSVWLAAFGTPAARRCGPVRFLVLGLASVIGGAAAHFLIHADSVMPMIGASAGISGLMGAAARFVFGTGVGLPQGRDWLSHHTRHPRLSLMGVMRNTRAALFLGTWFVTNLLFGLLATPLGVTDASIAWEAHMGGFLVGLLIFPLVDRTEPMRFGAT